jgi:hypothetical protein
MMPAIAWLNYFFWFVNQSMCWPQLITHRIASTAQHSTKETHDGIKDLVCEATTHLHAT